MAITTILTPNHGPVGAVIAVAGSGFTPNDTIIFSGFVFLAPPYLLPLTPAIPNIDNNGNWTATFVVPALPTGAYSYGAGDHSVASVPTPFTITVAPVPSGLWTSTTIGGVLETGSAEWGTPTTITESGRTITIDESDNITLKTSETHTSKNRPMNDEGTNTWES